MEIPAPVPVPVEMIILPIIPKLNKWNKIHLSLFTKTNNKSIVCFNSDQSLGNTLGLKKLTKYIRDIIFLNTNSLEIITGLILGDGYLKKGSKSKNVRLGFKQSIINFPFMWKVFTELSHYCTSLPRFEIAKIKNKKYGQLVLETRSYPVFNNLYYLFIDNNTKIVHPDLFFYLTPKALAYWIMSDGVSNQYGLTICTDSFSIKEVVTLMNILKIRYNLDTTIHYCKKKPRIYIKAKSMKDLRVLILPHMIPFSLYKLYKGKRC